MTINDLVFILDRSNFFCAGEPRWKFSKFDSHSLKIIVIVHRYPGIIISAEKCNCSIIGPDMWQLSYFSAYISKTYEFYSRPNRISCFLGAVSCGMGMEARHDRTWRCIMIDFGENWREHKKWTFWVLNITNLKIKLSTHSKTLQASPLTSLHLLPLSDDTTGKTALYARSMLFLPLQHGVIQLTGWEKSATLAAFR